MKKRLAVLKISRKSEYFTEKPDFLLKIVQLSKHYIQSGLEGADNFRYTLLKMKKAQIDMNQATKSRALHPFNKALQCLQPAFFHSNAKRGNMIMLLSEYKNTKRKASHNLKQQYDT